MSEQSSITEIASTLNLPLETAAFMELKNKIVQLMFEFTEKYCGKDNPNSLYPHTGYILVDVLTDCLLEAQYQVRDYNPLTTRQRDEICFKIGQWYLLWKDILVTNDGHRLGIAKEELKDMICGV